MLNPQSKAKLIDNLKHQGYPLTAQFYDGIAGLAVKLAAKYGKSQLEDDFIQVSLTTACRMEPKFSEEAGASFYTFINKPIKNDIQRHFGNPNRNTKKYKQIQRFIEDYNKQFGMYPDVQTISTGTKLSRFTILSVYYDKYTESTSLNDIHEQELVEDPFNNSDFKWVLDHMDVLTSDEKYIISALYELEMSLVDVSKAIGASTQAVLTIRDSALNKLRNSINNYQ